MCSLGGFWEPNTSYIIKETLVLLSCEQCDEKLTAFVDTFSLVALHLMLYVFHLLTTGTSLWWPTCIIILILQREGQGQNVNGSQGEIDTPELEINIVSRLCLTQTLPNNINSWSFCCHYNRCCWHLLDTRVTPCLSIRVSVTMFRLTHGHLYLHVNIIGPRNNVCINSLKMLSGKS